MTKSYELVQNYLDLCGVKGYEITEAYDEGQDLIFITCPKDFNPGLRKFLGKMNGNLDKLRRFLRFYGTLEGRNNWVVVKLTNGKEETN